MDEIITLAEMEGRYPSEWILVADPELDENHEVVRGRVLCHSKDRDEVDQKAVERRLPRSAFVFTGKIPEGTAVIL
jgi:hypothetical protein